VPSLLFILPISLRPAIKILKPTTMTPEMKYIYLKSHPLFVRLTDQKIQDICPLLKLKTVCRGEIIGYGEAGCSKIYLLLKGKIKITEPDNMDNELVKDILTAPDVFGDLGLDGHYPLDECATALTSNTIVCALHASDFMKLLQDNSAMALTYANIVNDKLRRLQGRHSDLVFRDAKTRLIGFIKNWARTDGNRIGNKIVLNNYLTHSDIAGAIATSRQSVNLLLNELRDAGLLFYNRQRIELNDPIIWN